MNANVDRKTARRLRGVACLELEEATFRPGRIALQQTYESDRFRSRDLSRTA
jgi:hypothetical protein